jgi:hypothetical protein
LTTEELDRKVDELLDELKGSTAEDIPAEGSDFSTAGDQDPPEAGLIDGEANSAMDDF